MGTGDGVEWVMVCSEGDIEKEDVVGFDHNGHTYAVYHTPSGFYATDGLCTHEQARLADGFVMGEFIECPKHNARFHIPSGKVKRVPARTGLVTYPVKVEGGSIYIGLSRSG
jgi:3-phenylpropionate/trans-cinnamate dioxygenase ferredoxin subunit